MPSTEEFFARYGPRYRWLATLCAMVAAIAVILSATIVNVAIPDVMGTFGIGPVAAQWLSAGFLAAMTATMLLADWANRAIGQRGSIIAALSLFLAGSLLGGVAPDQHVLVFARVVQGAAAGIVQPMAMIILFRVFPPERRGGAMGLYGIGVVLAPALGPWIGGLLMDNFNWRYVFYLGVPFAILGIVLAGAFLPGRESPDAPRPRFDWLGLALLGAFLAGLLSTLANGQRLGWSSNEIIAGFVLSAAAFAGFVAWERHSAHPMLDLSLFANGPFAAASVVSFTLGAGLFGSIYLLPLFVQTVQGLTPTEAGLMLMPAGFVLVIVFPIAGRLADRLAPGTLIAAGLVIFAWSSWLTARIDVNTAFWDLAWWTVLTRVGLGFVFPALTAGSLRVLTTEQIAQGSGSINFMRQLGGAFGVNLLSVFVAQRAALHGTALAATQTAANSVTQQAVDHLSGLMAAAGLPPAEQAPAAFWFLGQALYSEAATLAFRDGFLITAGVFLLALIPTWVLAVALRRSPRERHRPALASAS